MKKNYGMMALLAFSLTMSACYNDDDLWNKVDELETKIEANIQKPCLNSNYAFLTICLTALESVSEKTKQLPFA